MLVFTEQEVLLQALPPPLGQDRLVCPDLSAEMVHPHLQPLLPACWAVAARLASVVVHRRCLCCLGDHAAVGVSAVPSGVQHPPTKTCRAASVDPRGKRSCDFVIQC